MNGLASAAHHTAQDSQALNEWRDALAPLVANPGQNARARSSTCWPAKAAHRTLRWWSRGVCCGRYASRRLSGMACR